MNANSNIVASALTSCVGSFSSNMAIDTKVSAENKVVYGFAIIFMMSMGLVAQASQGSDVPEALNTFIGNHCIDCHDDAEASGGLNIQSLDWNLDDPHITNVWVRIHDRIATEEMPPEDASSLGEVERGAAIKDLAGRIQRFQEKNYAKHGRAVSRRVNRFEYENILRDLKSVNEVDGNLLDNTMILYGCHMGDANIHNNSNLPVILAGGGFRHGQHLAFNSQDNTPLCNVFVSMLQNMGVETDQFASSTGTLTGLV